MGRQTVQQGGGHLGITEGTGPLGKHQVGRDQHAGVLIKLGQQVEQQSSTNLIEWLVAQFIKDHQVHAHQTQRNAPGLALGLFLLQRVDQVDGRVDPQALAVLRQARDAQRRGQVGLACARPANEHRVLSFLGERQIRQFKDQGFVHGVCFKVKAGQIPVEREPSHLGLVRNGAHVTVDLLGLQPVQAHSLYSAFAGGALAKRKLKQLGVDLSRGKRSA